MSARHKTQAELDRDEAQKDDICLSRDMPLPPIFTLSGCDWMPFYLHEAPRPNDGRSVGVREQPYQGIAGLVRRLREEDWDGA